MYTVSRAPTRIINRTRRDISQIEITHELKRKNSSGSDDSDNIIMSLPKPTFNNSSKIGRNGNGKQNNLSQAKPTKPTYSQYQVEWANHLTKGSEEFDKAFETQEKEKAKRNISGPCKDDHYRVYIPSQIHPALINVKEFDFEAWWGNRVYEKIKAN